LLRKHKLQAAHNARSLGYVASVEFRRRAAELLEQAAATDEGQLVAAGGRFVREQLEAERSHGA
jgi:hypothetical protein